MFHKDANEYTAETKNLADESLLQDLSIRAFWICISAAIFLSAYGFTSLDFIQKFSPEITLWANLWPRLIFNTLPIFLLAWFLKKSSVQTNHKIAFFCFAFFFIYLGACLVYVWPLMWAGNKDIYFFVHSANAFIITIFLLILSPPPKYSIIALLSYFSLIATPVTYMIYRNNDMAMLNWFFNDISYATMISALFAHNIYLLRRKLARIDAYNKDRTKAYLGEHVADAILNRKEHELTGKHVSGFIVSIDLRGYTNFKKTATQDVYHNFMNAYHALVSQIVGKFGGYVHKTNGDGHLISFGVMNATEDLSDIPGLEAELKKVDRKRQTEEFKNASDAINHIQNEFFKLRNRYLINENLRVGSAICFGEVVMVHRGHESYKMEFDIDGEVIARAVRLEEYTKTLGHNLSNEEGYCIFSPELQEHLHIMSHIHKWEVSQVEHQVRDYPQMTVLFYKSFTNAFVEKYLAS